jgi:ATP-dependent metalloprotease
LNIANFLQDLQQATAIAYAMVTQFGMSSKLGNVDLRSNHDLLSSETKQLIESEVRRTIEEARVRATTLLKERRNELELLAKALIDYETLNKEEAFKVIKGERLEGKPVMPKGSIKLPEVVGKPGLGGPGGLGGVNGVPTLPGLPGAGPGEDGGNEPPKGGVMA